LFTSFLFSFFILSLSFFCLFSFFLFCCFMCQFLVKGGDVGACKSHVSSSWLRDLSHFVDSI
jgi:hypothetical protein